MIVIRSQTTSAEESSPSSSSHGGDSKIGGEVAAGVWTPRRSLLQGMAAVGALHAAGSRQRQAFAAQAPSAQADLERRVEVGGRLRRVQR